MFPDPSWKPAPGQQYQLPKQYGNEYALPWLVGGCGCGCAALLAFALLIALVAAAG